MTVLVAVADDAVRQRVLGVGVALGQALGEELYVVHLTDEEYADREIRAVRDRLRDELRDRGVAFSVSIEHVEHAGSRPGTAVGRQLADIASDVEITHVVVGHRSKELVGRLVRGDTAFALADAADVPVTVVPEGLDGGAAGLDEGFQSGRENTGRGEGVRSDDGDAGRDDDRGGSGDTANGDEDVDADGNATRDGDGNRSHSGQD
jgi:nucleotide-binding universal stress UspA family protein